MESHYIEQILRRFPELSASRFTTMHDGWDSVAVDADDGWIFKFPRHEAASLALRREARFLEIVRPLLSMPVPELRIHEGETMFSAHRKIPGNHLLGEHYQKLSESRRERLAGDLALFYHQLHQIDPGVMMEAGAHRIPSWPPAAEIIRDLGNLLEPAWKAVAVEALEAWKKLEPDPLGQVYGFFDGHGWNMAFDHREGRLNGIYDFADSGIGDVHREFIYTDFIDRDLTYRTAGAYEALAGVSLDRERIDLMTGVLRLSELAGNPDHPQHGDFIRHNAAGWLARRSGSDIPV